MLKHWRCSSSLVGRQALGSLVWGRRGWRGGRCERGNIPVDSTVSNLYCTRIYKNTHILCIYIIYIPIYSIALFLLFDWLMVLIHWFVVYMQVHFGHFVSVKNRRTRIREYLIVGPSLGFPCSNIAVFLGSPFALMQCSQLLWPHHQTFWDFNPGLRPDLTCSHAWSCDECVEQQGCSGSIQS